MRLRHIEVFNAIMLTGSISGAARLLNVSQPAVTKTLLHAEDQIGFKLFVRHRGRILPTAEANAIYQETTKLFGSVETVRSLTKNLKVGGQSVVRIGVPPALCFEVVPALLVKLFAETPDTVIEVNSYHYAGAINAVLRQEVHLAVGFNPQEHPALRIDRVATARFLGCFPQQLAGAVPAAVDFGFFRDKPFIALSGADPLGASIKAAFRFADVELRLLAEVNTNVLALRLVEQAAGVSIVDEFTAACASADTLVRPLDPELTFEVGVVTLANANPSNIVNRIRDLLAGLPIENSIRLASG